MEAYFLDTFCVQKNSHPKLIGSDERTWGHTSVNCGGARFRYDEEGIETWEYRTITGSHSPDGMRWTAYDDPIMPWYTDTHGVAFWDDRIERYVAYVRLNEHLRVDEEGRHVGSFDYRAVARSENADFAHFPPPAKVLEPDFSLPADEDQSGCGLYNSAAVKYPCAADAGGRSGLSYQHQLLRLG